MKKLVTSATICVLFIIFSGIVIADDDNAQPRPTNTRRRPANLKKSHGANMPGGENDRRNLRNREMMRRRQMQRGDESLKDKQISYRKLLNELESLKELALKENAKKTAKRIKKMIEDQKSEFAKFEKRYQDDQDRYREMMREHRGTEPSEARKAESKTSTTQKTEDKSEDKEDKVPWWKFWK